MVYFDCSELSLDDGSPLSETLPCGYDASWRHFGTQFWWSCLVWGILWLFCAFFGRIWSQNKGGRPWVKQWVGTVNEPAEAKTVDACLRFVQLCSSTFIFGCWIWKSYERRVAPLVYGMEIIACWNCTCHLIFSLIKHGFSTDYVVGLEGFIDVFTITPILLQGAPGGTWLTLAYLRTYRMKTAFYRICDTGVLEPYMSELPQALVKHFMDFLVCVTFIACTMYIFEGLGDVRYFQDNFIVTQMGATSFFQLCYMAMVTMTTVGYGDFSPTTVFNRLFFFVASAGGVCFFSSVASDLTELMGKLSSGEGKFRPKHPVGSKENPRGHIIVMGGGVASPSKACVEDFLKSLCRDEKTPEIVLLAPECHSEVRDLLNEPWAKKFQIQYFKGEATHAADLVRVRAEEASMTFIVADFFTAESYGEDYSNVLLAAALQAYCPAAQYRLMTIEIRHLELCISVGLSLFNCYAIEGLKAATLSTALKCPGLPTVVINMGLPDIEEPSPYEEPISGWLKEYIEAAGLEPYGFKPDLRFHNMTFKDVALAIAKESDAAVMAAQVDGLLRINPSKVMVDDDTILFALAADQKALDPVAANKTADVATWLPTFQGNRQRGGAAQVMAKLQEDLHFGDRYQDAGRESVVKRNSLDGATKQAAGAMLPGLNIKKAERRKSGLPNLASPHPKGNYPLTPKAALKSLPDTGGEIDSIVADGDHVVLALIAQANQDAVFQGMWQQVEIILKNLRTVTNTPVIVISAEEEQSGKDGKSKVDMIIEDYLSREEEAQIYVLEGDALKSTVLSQAGIETCANFMTLLPSSPSPGILMDRNNVLAQMVLDKKLRDCGRPELGAIFDWYADDSFRLMGSAPDGRMDCLSKGDQLYANETEPRCHYRFTSGRVLPKPMIAGLYSMAYYTPGVLELIEALIDPTKTNQDCTAYMMPVPGGFQNRPFKDFAETIIKTGGIPIGMYRKGADVSPLPYVLSCTPNSLFEVHEGDAVYVLADEEWAASNLNTTDRPKSAIAPPSPQISAADSGNAIEMVNNPHSRASNPDMAAKVFGTVGSSYVAPPAEEVVAPQRGSAAKV